jgi:hypothetical protein
MMGSYDLNAWIHNVHALELNLIFLRREVIGAEGICLFEIFPSFLLLCLVLVEEQLFLRRLHLNAY